MNFKLKNDKNRSSMRCATLRQALSLFLLALAACSYATAARVEDVPLDKDFRAQVEYFSKQAFTAIYTLPRTDALDKRTRELIPDKEVRSEYLYVDRYPIAGLESIEELKTNYAFIDDLTEIKEFDGKFIVSVFALQELSIRDRVVGRNCVATYFELNMPRGAADTRAATIARIATLSSSEKRWPKDGPCNSPKQ